MLNRKLFLAVFAALSGAGLLLRPLNYDPYNHAIACKLFVLCPVAGFPFDLRPYNDGLATYPFDFVVLALNLCVLIVTMLTIFLLITLLSRLSKKKKTHAHPRY